MRSNLEKVFSTRAINTILNEQNCYLQCSEKPLDPVPELEKARFSSSDNATFCQHQFWRNHTTTGNVFLYGLDVLRDPNNMFNVTIDYIEQAAIKKWRHDRKLKAKHKDKEPELTVNDLIPDDSDTKPKGGMGLPVCLTTMKPGLFHTKDNNEDKKLPCVCGDILGSETPEFFQNLKISNWVNYHDGTGLAQACQTSFDRDKTSATQVFHTYCQLQQHFPTMYDRVSSFAPGQDWNCQHFEGYLAKVSKEDRIKGDNSIWKIDCLMCHGEVRNHITAVQDLCWAPEGACPVKGGDSYNFGTACNLHNPESCLQKYFSESG